MKPFRPVARALRGVFVSDFRTLVWGVIVAQIRAPLRPTPRKCLRSDTDAFDAGSRGWNAPSLIPKAARAAPNPSGDGFSGNAQVDPRRCLHFVRIDRAVRAGAAAPKAAVSARAAAVASVSGACNAGARDAGAHWGVFARNFPIRNSSVPGDLPFPKTCEWFRETTLLLLR